MLGTIYPILGWLIATRRPENRIGWMFLVIGLSQAASGFVSEYAIYGLLTRPGALPIAEIAAWIGVWVWVPGFVLLFVTILLFPDGRLPSRRWRPVLWVGVGRGRPGARAQCRRGLGLPGRGPAVERRGRSGERPVDDDLRCDVGDRAAAHHPGGSRRRRGGGDQVPAHEQRRAAADQVARGGRRRRGRLPGLHELRHAAVSGRHHRGAPDHAARPDRHRDRDPALSPLRHRPDHQPHDRLGDRDRECWSRRSSCSIVGLQAVLASVHRGQTRSRSRHRRSSRSRCSSRCAGACRRSVDRRFDRARYRRASARSTPSPSACATRSSSSAVADRCRATVDGRGPAGVGRRLAPGSSPARSREVDARPSLVPTSSPGRVHRGLASP